jgi:hypothetical protein
MLKIGVWVIYIYICGCRWGDEDDNDNDELIISGTIKIRNRKVDTR